MSLAGGRLGHKISLAVVVCTLAGCELFVGTDPGGDGGVSSAAPITGGSTPDAASPGSAGDDGGSQAASSSGAGSSGASSSGNSSSSGASSSSGGGQSSGGPSSSSSSGGVASSSGSGPGSGSGGVSGDASIAGQDATTSSSGGPGPGTDSGATEGGAVCGSTIPAGWIPVLYNATLDSCPTGFNEHVVMGTPSVAAGACGCTCSVTQPGACDPQSLRLTVAPGHGVDTCTTNWFTPAASSSCIAVPAASQTGFDSYQATATTGAASGGTCAGQAQTNSTALSEPTQRFCDVPASSADAVCGGTAPAGFSACIIAAGQVACPTSTPFVHATTVETGATLSCGSCSACSVSTTCGNGSVEAFTNGNCTAPAAFTFPADGTCVASGAGEGTAFASIRFDATANATCTAGTSTPAVQLTGAQTICCR